VPALADVVLTSTITAADAWRDSAARWERRAETCLGHLEAQVDRARGCDAVVAAQAEVTAPTVIRSPSWAAAGALGGAGLGIAGTALAVCPDDRCGQVGIVVGLVSALAGLAVAVLW